MEITSGGTPGPRPDDALEETGFEVHAGLHGAPAPPELAAAFAGAGWSARRSAWDEFEVAETWAELRLFARMGASSLYGVILPDRVEDLVDMLRRLGVACAGEVYDRHGELVRRFGTHG